MVEGYEQFDPYFRRTGGRGVKGTPPSYAVEKEGELKMQLDGHRKDTVTCREAQKNNNLYYAFDEILNLPSLSPAYEGSRCPPPRLK